ncbi:MAG: PKD domain-containing protein [Rhizobacter sp.]|nr:PKD domain-containing protein [Ferruginibacter sp.]
MNNWLPRPFGIVAILLLFSYGSKAQLAAQFTATVTEGCSPLIVRFNDQSAGNPTQWKWDLGNSTISYLQNPTVTYFNPGTYPVKLVIQNAGGIDSIVKSQYITIHAAPVVNFTAAVTSGCLPLTIPFTNNSTAGSGVINTYLWDFGDGTSSTAANPSHTYTSAGSYNVSLKITNSKGCTQTFYQSNYITAFPEVQSAFTIADPTGCTAPHTVNFQSQSAGNGILSYAWLFGDGGSSTLANPSHTYTATGIYTVKLITSSADGCRDTATLTNAVHVGSLQPSFTAPAICEGVPVTFTNTSAPAPDSVVWNFGDGTTSTIFSPVKTFAAAGNYSIKLLGYFAGCKDSVINNVTVTTRANVNFNTTDTAGCKAPYTVSFNNVTTGAINYSWNFGDGNTSTLANPVHTYTTAGTFTVMLIATNANGCSDTLVKNNYIKIQLPEVNINQLTQKGCAPFSWTFSSTINSVEPIAEYLWNFGDGNIASQQNPTHVFATGSYDITLIVTTISGCKDTAIVAAGIIASVKPQPAFTATPRDVCAFSDVNFTDNSTGTITEWLWYFGDGGSSTAQNPTHQYQDTGMFTVTLLVGNNGCYDTLKNPNYIHVKPPIANFEVNFNCDQPYVRNFTDRSIGADEWSWNFGDGNTSTLVSPVHTYATPGTYTVQLTVRNLQTGCSHTKTGQVIIADEVADFSASQTEFCARSGAVFTATNRYPGGIINYQWNFGDGGTATGQTTTHSYLSSGNYTVTLIITDAAGCKDTAKLLNYIRVNGPVANFNAAVPGSCLNTAVNFNDLSTTDGIHPITEWTWNYGDGNTAILTAPPFTHAYAGSGIYNVSLTIKDAAGCTGTITKPNHLVISTPVAAFKTTVTLSCPGSGVVFSNQSTGPQLTYAWDFGDGQTSTLATPAHVYTATGLYAVTLRITDKYGCSSELIKNNYIRIVLPVADFMVSDSTGSCPPLIVQFSNISVNQATYRWDFGDGTFSNAASPSHFYNESGVFVAKLTITSAGGCTSVKTKTITVKGPKGSFTYTNRTGCAPLTVNFIGSTQNRSSFVWDFNDGNTITTNDSIISHTYTIPGIYLPKMILKDAAGCTVPITGKDTIFVKGITAAFTADKFLLCDNGNVQFINNSVSNDAIVSYHWNFGDGQTSSAVAPMHNYTATGIYVVKLKVTTASGCRDSVSSAQPIKIVKAPSISITQSANGCIPLLAQFTGNLLNADTAFINWQWSFSDGRIINNKTIDSLSFVNGGTYNITLSATNSSGCKDTAMSSIQAFALPGVNAGTDKSICLGSGKALNATGAASYTWSPATGLSCTNCPSPLANPAIATQYIVTGKSAAGCIKKDSVWVNVHKPFRMQAGRADTLCAGESATLIAMGASTYQWSPSTGLNNTTGAVVKASPATTTRYMLVGSDSVGCFKDTAYFPVKVYPIPTVNAGADIIMNVGQTKTIMPVISNDVTQVTWTPSTGIIRTIYPGIEIKPNYTTDYLVRVSNPGACTATDNVRVQVLCNNANVFIPNTFSPNGNGANEIFYPRGTGLFTIKSARIFNRWGEMVFERNNFKANDAGSGWDGSFRGQKLNPDVFVYVFEIICDNKETIVYKGDVALIR